MDNIINKCWTSRYERISEILDDLETLICREEIGNIWAWVYVMLERTAVAWL